MRNALLILSFLFFGLQGFSQDPYLQKSDPTAKQEAISLTNKYDKQLAMDGEQKLLFQNKVEEFLIRRKKIEKELTGRKKLDYLFDLQQEETAEMQDILTRIQLQVYKQIKPDLQPLEVVKKE